MTANASTLREAAARLRGVAGEATPGPWNAVAGAWGLPSDGPDHMRVVQGQHRNASDAIVRTDYDRQGGADAEHIALMDPLVALALADWLDDEARRLESNLLSWQAGEADPSNGWAERGLTVDSTVEYHFHYSLKLAQLILGGTR